MIGKLITLKETKTLSLVITTELEDDAVAQCEEIAEALEDAFSKKWEHEIIGDSATEDFMNNGYQKNFHFHLTFEISSRKIDTEINALSKREIDKMHELTHELAKVISAHLPQSSTD